MKIINKNGISIFNGFLIGVILTAMFFYLAKHPSYEECVINNLPNAHTDRAAKMLQAICKKLENKPKYNFSGITGLFEKDKHAAPRYIFEDEHKK
jgi:hypothetical protein